MSITSQMWNLCLGQFPILGEVEDRIAGAADDAETAEFLVEGLYLVYKWELRS